VLWGCGFEDFLGRYYGDENIVDLYLKRRGWKETAANREYFAALRDTPNGKDRFDAEVKQVMRAWSLLKPSGADYVMVAQLVAARHNTHDGELELPMISIGDAAHVTSQRRTTDAWFEECYPPYLEELDDLYYRTMTTTAKLVAPANTDDCSPFRSLLPQMPEDSAARQYERLAIKHDQVRVAGQAPVGAEDDYEDVDSDADLLDETFSIVDDNNHTGMSGQPYYRPSRAMPETGSTASLDGEGGVDTPLLTAPRVVLAAPGPEVLAAFRWHVQPWLLARRLLDRTNDQSALMAAEAAAGLVVSPNAEPRGRKAESHALFRTPVPHSAAAVSAIARGDFLQAVEEEPTYAVEHHDPGSAPASAPAGHGAHPLPTTVFELDPDIGSDGEMEDEPASSLALPLFQRATYLSAPSSELDQLSAPSLNLLRDSVSSSAEPHPAGQPSPPPPFACAPAPEGFPGDGWPELRERGGEPGARLLRTTTSLVKPLPTASEGAPEPSMVMYRRAAAMVSSSILPELTTEHEVIHTYLARAEGRLARAVRLANAAVGLPIRPLA
jgi:hypothetical protein